MSHSRPEKVGEVLELPVLPEISHGRPRSFADEYSENERLGGKRMGTRSRRKQ